MQRFYNVRTRSFVEVDDSDVTKKKYVRTTKNGTTQTRYAIRAQVDGASLTKFVSEAAYSGMSVPEEN